MLCVFVCYSHTLGPELWLRLGGCLVNGARKRGASVRPPSFAMCTSLALVPNLLWPTSEHWSACTRRFGLHWCFKTGLLGAVACCDQKVYSQPFGISGIIWGVSTKISTLNPPPPAIIGTEAACTPTTDTEQQAYYNLQPTQRKPI